MGTHHHPHNYGVPDAYHGAFFHGDASATIKITGRPPKAIPSQGGHMGMSMSMMYPGMMHSGNMGAYVPQHHRAMYQAPPMAHVPQAPRPPLPEAAPAPATCGDWNNNDMSQMFGAGPDDLDGGPLSLDTASFISFHICTYESDMLLSLGNRSPPSVGSPIGFTDADLAFLREMVDGPDDIDGGDASVVVSTAQPKLQVR
jgi:hypothetical protein